MRERDKNLIEDNWDKLEITMKTLISKFNIPQNEADDYRQTGYLALCTKAYKYDGRTKFTTFANIVIKNAFIDKYRSEKNNKQISLDEMYSDVDNENQASLDKFLASTNNTENEAISNITEEIVRKYIHLAKDECNAQKTKRSYEALELKIKGFNNEEIAKMFNMPSNCLRALISRAKKTLSKETEFAELIKEL